MESIVEDGIRYSLLFIICLLTLHKLQEVYQQYHVTPEREDLIRSLWLAEA